MAPYVLVKVSDLHIGCINEHEGWSVAQGESQRPGQHVPQIMHVDAHEHSRGSPEEGPARTHVSANGSAVDALYCGLATQVPDGGGGGAVAVMRRCGSAAVWRCGALRGRCGRSASHPPRREAGDEGASRGFA